MTPFDRMIRQLGNDKSDLDTKEIIQEALTGGSKITRDTIEWLCTHDKCRPQTLKLLIRQYLKTNHPSQQEINNTMNRSLVAFANNSHIHERFLDIKNTVIYLRKHGADPMWKDENGHDALDYAHMEGGSRSLDTLLRSCITNPVRKIKKMLKREQGHPSPRDYMLNFLENKKDDFQTQQGFARKRTYSALMPIIPINR